MAQWMDWNSLWLLTYLTNSWPRPLQSSRCPHSKIIHEAGEMFWPSMRYESSGCHSADAHWLTCRVNSSVLDLTPRILSDKRQVVYTSDNLARIKRWNSRGSFCIISYLCIETGRERPFLHTFPNKKLDQSQVRWWQMKLDTHTEKWLRHSHQLKTHYVAFWRQQNS